MALPPILNKQVGPFKLWVWGALVGAGVGAGVLWRTFGGGEAPAPTSDDKAAPPVIATEPVGYVYADEGDGQTRIDRPDYNTETPPQQAPQPGAPPITQPPPPQAGGGSATPPKQPTPRQPAKPEPKPTMITGLTVKQEGSNARASWNAIDPSYRVVLNDKATTPESNIVVTPYGAKEAVFTPQAGRRYSVVAYKQLKPLVNSDPTAPVIFVASSRESAKKYPGLADNFVMDCQTTSLSHIVRTLDEVDVRNYGSTLAQRKKASWALANTGSPRAPNYALIWHTGLAQQSIRALTNQDRVANGLYPLTDADFDRIVADMRAMMPNEYRQERDAVFQNGSYANALFQKYNLPYQCRGASVRTIRTADRQGGV